MINVKEKLETPEHESTLIVQETLKKKKRYNKDVYPTLVDPFEYAKEKVANFKADLLEEILTLDKKQIIKYNGIEIKTE